MLTDLPDEVQQLVIRELDATRDLASLQRTCQTFRNSITPILWSFAKFQLDNLTRENWPNGMYVDDELRQNLPLLSEDPFLRRYLTIGVGTFPGFCRQAANFHHQLKHVQKLLISIPFYTKHEPSTELALNCLSDYDDYLAWFAQNMHQLFPNVSAIEIESDTLHDEHEQLITQSYHPLLPRIFKQFPLASKNLKLSLSREIELFDTVLPFEFRIIKLRYGYTQIVNNQLCTAGDDDITAKVKIGQLPSSCERFEIDTEHRLVDLGELKPIFNQCNKVKMLSLDVNHEFKNLEWLPHSVKDLNFCGLPGSCPPRQVDGVSRLTICLEELKVFQVLRCPNVEFLHIHSLQPEEARCDENFIDSLKYCPNVKRLKCSGSSARTITTIVQNAGWKLESLSIEYDPYQSVYHNKRLASVCHSIKNLWICSHKGDIVDILYAYTSKCHALEQLYLTWEGWVWRIGVLLENDLIQPVPRDCLLGKYTFLDGHMYNQTFELDIARFNRWYHQTHHHHHHHHQALQRTPTRATIGSANGKPVVSPTTTSGCEQREHRNNNNNSRRGAGAPPSPGPRLLQPSLECGGGISRRIN